MNPKWLENKIIEMSEDIRELKELLRAVAKAPTKGMTPNKGKK
jgi:hypothetical protein